MRLAVDMNEDNDSVDEEKKRTRKNKETMSPLISTGEGEEEEGQTRVSPNLRE